MRINNQTHQRVHPLDGGFANRTNEMQVNTLFPAILDNLTKPVKQ